MPAHRESLCLQHKHRALCRTLAVQQLCMVWCQSCSWTACRWPVLSMGLEYQSDRAWRGCWQPHQQPDRGNLHTEPILKLLVQVAAQQRLGLRSASGDQDGNRAPGSHSGGDEGSAMRLGRKGLSKPHRTTSFVLAQCNIMPSWIWKSLAATSAHWVG